MPNLPCPQPPNYCALAPPSSAATQQIRVGHKRKSGHSNDAMTLTSVFVLQTVRFINNDLKQTKTIFSNQYKHIFIKNNYHLRESVAKVSNVFQFAKYFAEIISKSTNYLIFDCFLNRKTHQNPPCWQCVIYYLCACASGAVT
ncbi:MAG: hypothetical protein ACI308_08700 [Muribaculaceae bacterium]